MTAREAFNEAVKGKNVVTPTIIDFYGDENLAIEFSTGKFMGSRIYGVTVVKNGKHDTEASMSFHDKIDAEEYIDELLSGERRC